MRLFECLEKINSECKGFQIFPKRACRVDGEKGIKKHLKLNLSSCDYFHIKKQNKLNIVTMIEFTDLKKQKENLERSKKLCILEVEKMLETMDELSAKNCKEKIKNQLNSLRTGEIKRKILDELRRKAIESIVIFYQLRTGFNIKESNIKNSKFCFYVVICSPLDDDFFIENLKVHLKDIIKDVIEDIKIIPIKDFNLKNFGIN